MYSGVIYIYESPSHKYYIGQTTRPNRRKTEHKTHLVGRQSKYPFHRAIAKYGFDSFKYKELFFVQRDSKEELKTALDDLEKYLIRDYNALKIPLYNASDGGESIFDHTGEHLSNDRKEHIRQWAKNFHASMTEEEKLEHNKKISEGRKKPILQYDKEGNFIQEWPTVEDVPFAKKSALRMCLTGKNKTCAGYIWKYKS